MIDIGVAPYTEHRYPALRQSIMLFDINPGTRQLTLEPGRYRVAVVGAGAGFIKGGGGGGYDEVDITVPTETVYAYTVGESAAAIGGTSSFAGILSATGGQNSLGGQGLSSFGKKGGAGYAAFAAGEYSNGGAAGHAFGNGASATRSVSTVMAAGPGFSEPNRGGYPGGALVDGWKVGLLPTEYGYGAVTGSYNTYQRAGMGGGGVGGADAGVGGGSGDTLVRGGHGAVIVERIG
ncbi:hypothetical protein [Aeromonas salmonicida]|uniref:hypothetical protein n=1 Tax=Aeromonas salmonicida TaxID=645 RepID=UPI00223EF3F8|nr:hypothetical protein [Aeromonas salmonicida]